MKRFGRLIIAITITAALGCKSGKHGHGGCNDCPDLTKKSKHALLLQHVMSHVA